MIWIDADLLVRGEWEHMVAVVLVSRGRTAHVTTGAEDHGLALVHATTRVMGQSGVGGIARQLGRQELVFGQLAVAVVLHSLAHLGSVGRGVGGRRRHIGMVAGVHLGGRCSKTGFSWELELE